MNCEEFFVANNVFLSIILVTFFTTALQCERFIFKKKGITLLPSHKSTFVL